MLRGMSLAGIGVLGASLLAACGASGATTAAATSAAATSAAATSAAATSAAAASASASSTSASTTASAAAAAALGAAATPTPGVVGNIASKKGVVNWLVRTGIVENKWEKTVAVPQFQKANPSLSVNLIIAPWAQFDPKLFTLFAADTPVDIWSHWGQSGFADYVHKGMVADLTPYIGTDHYDLTAFLPGIVDIYKQQGKYLGLPNDTTFGMPLFYDAALLQKAGVTPPPQDWTNPWSWAEFVDAGKKLTSDYGAPTAHYGITMSTDLQLLARLGGNNLYAKEALNTGIAKPADYRANTDQTLAGVQAVYDLIFKDKVMPTQQLSSALSSGGIDPFRAQRVAMNLDGGWQYWSYQPQIHDFTWASGADPKLVTNLTTEYTDPWMMSSKSKDAESTWTFMKYLVSEPSQVAYMQATGAPPANAAAAQQWISAFVKTMGLTSAQVTAVAFGALKNGNESYNHLLVGYDQIATAETQALNLVWTGKLSPHDGLAQAEQNVKAALASIQ